MKARNTRRQHFDFQMLRQEREKVVIVSREQENQWSYRCRYSYYSIETAASYRIRTPPDVVPRAAVCRNVTRIVSSKKCIQVHRHFPGINIR
jgi:hypothetical protein